DVVLVETVGVGQSETMVAQMVDIFLVLVLAGGGDDLQGIKRGILELADAVVVTKSDGENKAAAARAQADYRAALDLVPARLKAWDPVVVTCSALTGDGLEALWTTVTAHRSAFEASGDWDGQRAEQRVGWMTAAVTAGLAARFEVAPRVRSARAALEAKVRDGDTSPDHAAKALLAAFFDGATD
ncbi:MAG: methylmalonyl Co-A mutase-associated GTPase MeaB, partial [Nannocystaceae bacterium]|nr:methylmalonyl Co-A mutase-associated GTPase MeaB [Nannocystaceae bacterium]